MTSTIHEPTTVRGRAHRLIANLIVVVVTAGLFAGSVSPAAATDTASDESDAVDTLLTDEELAALLSGTDVTGGVDPTNDVEIPDDADLSGATTIEGDGEFNRWNVPGGGGRPSTRRVKNYAVVLGDSYSAGEGAGYGNSAAYDRRQPGCDNHRYGYHKRLKMPVITYACQGAKYRHMTSPYTVESPTSGSSTRSPQLTSLARYIERRRAMPRYIVLSIGGNDLGFGTLFQDCVIGKVSIVHQYRCSKAVKKIREHKLDDHYRRVRNTLRMIHHVSPRSRVIVVGYPSYFAADSRGATCPVRWSTARQLSRLTSKVNGAAKEAAYDVGRYASYVSTTPAFAGHRACDGWMGNDWFVPIRDRAGGDNEAGHPRADGYAAMAGEIRSCMSGWSSCRRSTQPRSDRYRASFNSLGESLLTDEDVDAPLAAGLEVVDPAVVEVDEGVQVTWTPRGTEGEGVTVHVLEGGVWTGVLDVDAAAGAAVIAGDTVVDGCVGVVALDATHEAGPLTKVCTDGTVEVVPESAAEMAGLTASDLAMPGDDTEDDPVIEAFNLAPTAASTAMGMRAGMAHNRSVGPLVSDPEGDAVTYELVSTGFDRSGFRFGWDPATGNFSTTVPACNGGGSNLRYRVRDQFGAVSSTETVTLDFVDMNRAPWAGDGAQGMRAGRRHYRSVARYASDADGDGLTYQLMGTGFSRKGFKLSWNSSNGSFAMTVPKGNGGASHLKYRVIDRCGVVSRTAIVRLDFVR